MRAFCEFAMIRISKLFKVLIAAVMISTVASCVSPSVVDRLTALVEYSESVEGIPDEEWESIKQDFYMAVDEFRVNLESYSEEERTQIYELIGRMNGIIAKREATEAVGDITNFIESLPSIINGFVEGFKTE